MRLKKALIGFKNSRWPGWKLLGLALLLAVVVVLYLYRPPRVRIPVLPPEGSYPVTGVWINEPYSLDPQGAVTIGFVQDHRKSELVLDLTAVGVKDGPENLLVVEDGTPTLIIKKDLAVSANSPTLRWLSFVVLVLIVAAVLWLAMATTLILSVERWEKAAIRAEGELALDDRTEPDEPDTGSRSPEWHSLDDDDGGG